MTVACFAWVAAAAALPGTFFTEVRALVAAAAALFPRDFVATCTLAATAACSAFVAFFFDPARAAAVLSFVRVEADPVTLRETIFSVAAAFICADFTRGAAGRTREAEDLIERFFSGAALRDFAFALPARVFLEAAALVCLLVPLTDAITRYSSVAPLWRRDPRPTAAHNPPFGETRTSAPNAQSAFPHRRCPKPSEARPPPRSRQTGDGPKAHITLPRTPRANQMRLSARSTVKNSYITKMGQNQKNRIRRSS